MHNERDAGVRLLPCPFCGGSPRRSFTQATDTFAFWSVECSKCGVEIADDESQSAADAHWNTRPPAPEDAGTVERALQGLSDIFEHFKDRKQAPGHSHDVPGIWDNYNGDKSGKPCDWCAKWNAARAALAALSRLDGEAGK